MCSYAFSTSLRGALNRFGRSLGGSEEAPGATPPIENALPPPKWCPQSSQDDPTTTPNSSQKLPRTLRGSSWSRPSYLTAFRAAKWYPRNSQNDPQTTPNPPPNPTAPHCRIRVSLHSLSTVRDGFCYLSADFAHVFRMRHALHGFLQQHLLGRPQNSHKRSECILPPLFAHFLAKLLQPHLRISIYFFTPPHRHFSFAFKLCR